MSLRRRALFLAGLFVAVSCSDAGNPLAPGGPDEGPDASPSSVLTVLTCTVDVGDADPVCVPAEPGTGAALGAVATGNNTYVKLTSSNKVETADSTRFDLRVTNLIPQPIGTLDGTTPHPNGIRVWITVPIKVDTLIDGQPASVTVTNADGVLSHYSYKNQPYFQFAGPLATGVQSGARTVRFAKVNAGRFTYTAFVLTEVPNPKGWMDIAPLAPAVQVGSVDTVTAQVRGAFGQQVSEAVTWSSSDSSIVTVAELGTDSLAAITGVSEGQAWIRARSVAEPVVRGDSVLVVVDNAPVVNLDSINAVTNVQVRVSSARLRQVLAGSDSVVPNQVIETEHGHAVIDADRGLTYVSDGGYSGVDTVSYQVTDGRWSTTGKLLVKVEPSNYWFVREGGTGDGSNTRPLGSVSAAATAADVGDTIFVLRNGANDLAGAAQLDAGQALIGAGVPAAFLLARADLNEPARVDTIFQGQGLGTPLTSSGSPTLTLASNNTVRGINLTSTAAAAIRGSGFGTLTVGDVIVQADGPALSLSSGTLAGTFTALHSAGSDSTGLTLVNVAGTLAPTAASISGAATTAVLVNGGSVAVTFPGTVTHAGNQRLLDVSGGHTGSLTFQGALSATTGTGILFSNADGTYAFDGAVTLNGGDAGLDVADGTDGVITFANASITNPSGHAVNVVGGTPALVYRGSITHDAGRALVVDGLAGDSVVIRAALSSGTSGNPTGLGIAVTSVTGGRVVVDSIKTLYTGANPAVSLTGNTGGTIRFGGSMAITTTTGTGFVATGSDTVMVTGTNTVSTSTGTPVSLTNVHTGASGVSFSSVGTSGAANGIVLNGLAGGAGFQATGGTIATTLAAVSLTSLASVDSVSLRNLALSRASGSGAVISGTNFGKLHTLGTTVSATGGPGALELSSGTLSGSFASLSSSGSTGSAVSLSTVGGTLTVNGGTLAGGSTTTFTLSGGSVGGTVSATVGQSNAQPLLSVTGGHSGSLTFAGVVGATNGTGLQFPDADGTYTFTGNFSLAGGDAGIDIGSASTGTVDVSPSGGNSAGITSPSGTAISVVGGSADLTFRGNVTQASNASLLSVTGGHNGDLSFPSGTISATNGNGLQFDNADGSYVFGGTVTLNGGDAGIDVTNGSGGTFTFPSTASITNPGTGNLVSILNSAPTFTYSGSFSKSNNNVTGILLSSNTGGQITFNGTGTKSISSGNAAAVNLSSNTGASILFSGGGLVLTSGSGMGFTATGGGTVQVTGATNTISAGTGTALNVQNTTIGASGMSFQSIAHTGGSNGIVLNNTGSTNGVQVTGTGGAGSGGTISGTTGDGVALTSATRVRLTSMVIQNSGGSGISGSSVTHFSLKSSSVTSSGNALGEAGLEFDNLFGTDSIYNSTITGSAEDNVVVRNNTGTLDSLVVTGSTISSNSSIGSDGILVTASNTATATVRVRGNTFTANRGDHFQATASNSANLNVVLFQNTMSGGHAQALGQGVTLGTGLTFAGTFTYDLNDNDILNGAISNAITIDHDGTTGSLMQGRVRNNVIGTSGSDLSCSAQASGIEIENGNRGTHTYAVTGNTIRRCYDRGIFLDNGDGTNVTVNATVTGNTVNELTTANARQALYVNVGAFDPNFLGNTDSFTVCADIQGNNLTSQSSYNTEAIRLRMRFNSRMNLPGYAGSFNNASNEVNTYLASRNTLNGQSASATTTASGSPYGYYNAGASCPTPP